MNDNANVTTGRVKERVKERDQECCLGEGR